MYAAANWRNERKFRPQLRDYSEQRDTPKGVTSQGFGVHLPTHMESELRMAEDMSEDATRYLKRAGVEPLIFEMLGLEVTP